MSSIQKLHGFNVRSSCYRRIKSITLVAACSCLEFVNAVEFKHHGKDELWWWLLSVIKYMTRYKPALRWSVNIWGTKFVMDGIFWDMKVDIYDRITELGGLNGDLLTSLSMLPLLLLKREVEIFIATSSALWNVVQVIWFENKWYGFLIERKLCSTLLNSLELSNK